MVSSVSTERPARALEFGMYRDGDNNLDDIQSATIAQAVQTSRRDPTIEFTVEDTTARGGFEPAHVLRTESYTIAGGAISKHVAIDEPHDMSARSDLATFVDHVLDDAQKSSTEATWIDLVDHGGGDGGGLQSTHSAEGIMREDDIAGAIADGVALHAKEHPEDANRKVDGIVANQCLMATVGFSSALSHAGVAFLAASPETMLAPGVPSQVAHDIASHIGAPAAMANAVVKTTMDETYGAGGIGSFGPAAAFDVIDLDPAKTAAVATAVRMLDSSLVGAAGDPTERAAIRNDAKAVDGMVRFPDGKGLPWRADRPAIALYRTFAEDGRLGSNVRAAALHAADAIADTVLAHRESDDFAPFNDADYSDAYGPTVRFPVDRKQVDTWAPQISETDNAFYKSVGAAALSKVIA
ncbi:MAG: hypothetical protein M3R44_01030 [Candidatus Eremiobacteraeota bacterium]|nr:hypothetical protein [Candidatus Eremiobacteraeota bacterium]